MKAETERPITISEFVAMPFEAFPAPEMAVLLDMPSNWERRTAKHGPIVRAMALVLRDTDKELEERMRDSEDPDGTVEAFTELVELLNDQSSFYRGVSDIMNTAAMRLEIVLGRVANIVDEIDGHEGHHPT